MLRNSARTQSEKSNTLRKALTAFSNEPLDLKMQFAIDINRHERFSVEASGLFLDFSKNLIDERIFSHLVQLAESVCLPDAIEALFQSKHVNATENKAAKHWLLREERASQESDLNEVLEERAKLFEITNKFQSGQWMGATHKPLKTVVNIGIGGSDLGPRMASHALLPYHQKGLSVHFVSNGDPTELTVLLEKLNPEEVLFILSSKSFQTEETLLNAKAAQTWLLEQLGQEGLVNHFVAVTAHPDRVRAQGFVCREILKVWDWVGGRFSVWSSIGLPLALMIGADHFLEFLSGAREMDRHFRFAPFNKNMPIILALLGEWYINFKHIHQHAVIPYHQLLYHFPSFLEQLEMESNGKSVNMEGTPITFATCPVLWGGIGSNSQHAFHQFLHQGTHWGPIDFIVAAQNSYETCSQHLYLVAQCISQAEVLMHGHVGAAHQRLVGNRPSNMLLLSCLTPHALGALIALYEHKVYAQSVFWGINAFDQPGVERGKVIAKQNFNRLQSKKIEGEVDASTRQLLDKIFKMT